jgi:hypothetical protein
MLTTRQRIATLWRASRTADAPLARRIWGLVVALLPLRVRRLVLRAVALLASATRWPVPVRRAAQDLGGYLAMSAVALLLLWIWSRIGALVCGDTPAAHCATDRPVIGAGHDRETQSKRTQD